MDEIVAKDRGQNPLSSIYVFSGSPFEAFRQFSLVSKLRFGHAALRVFLNPRRTDMIFAAIDTFVKNESKLSHDLHRYLGELRRHPDLNAMVENGYRMPQIDVAELLRCPAGSLGQAFGRHLHDNELEPGFYSKVPEGSSYAWLEMRGREIHDIIHVLTGFGIDVAGEIGVQAFMLAQVTSPASAMIVGGGLAHAGFFKPWTLPSCLAAVQQGFGMGLRVHLPSLFSTRFELHWHRPLSEVRAKLGIIVSDTFTTD